MKCFFSIAGAADDPDDDGVDVASVNDARLQASRFLSGLIGNQPELVWIGKGIQVIVKDENRALWFTLIAFSVDSPAVTAHPASFDRN